MNYKNIFLHNIAEICMLFLSPVKKLFITVLMVSTFHVAPVFLAGKNKDILKYFMVQRLAAQSLAVKIFVIVSELMS